jgi:phosphonate transport system substrate-binding protein
MDRAAAARRRSTISRVAAMLGWLLVLSCPMTMATSGDAAAAAPIRFGILPIGSAAESREQWKPLLTDLGQRLKHPVDSVSVSSYAGLSDAIGEQRVDVAFLSGRLALDAVMRQHMQVIAQFVRSDGAKGNVGMLLVRGDGPIRDLQDLLASPGRWRYARGEPMSVTGYIAPEADVFAPRGLNSDTFFASVRISNHQNNALAVANHEADVASGNNPDLDLFRRSFPQEAAQLKVIWRSPLIPAGVLVIREHLPEPLRDQLADFLRDYGKRGGAEGERERARLARIPDLAGFAVADNTVLRPFVDMAYTLKREQASHGQWVTAQAQQDRLAQIERDYRQALQQLGAH